MQRLETKAEERRGNEMTSFFSFGKEQRNKTTLHPPPPRHTHTPPARNSFLILVLFFQSLRYVKAVPGTDSYKRYTPPSLSLT